MRTTFACAAALIALSTAASDAAAQQRVQGDKQAGERKASMCIGCHSIPGYQASFPEVHKVPMISGQTAVYLQTALAEYKRGERRHPTMRAIAASLGDQDMADLAAYYESQKSESQPPAKPAVEPSAEVAALLQKGACAGCHGDNFSTPKDPSYPKLAGQHPDYLYVAMKAYQTRNNPQVGRDNAIMSGMTAPFTHQQLKQIAQYIGSLPGELQVAAQSRFK